ncbi:MAG: FHA domain-containing protein [Planctomycetota bacterium]|jgi:hypothetical protein
MLQALLKVVGGKQDGKLIPLDTKKFLIGREQDCHLRPGSESVSRHHCVINVDEFSVRVRDLGSSNGTFLNGTRIIGVQEAHPGDLLKVGSLEFEMVFSEAAAPVAVGPDGEKGGTTFNLTEFSLDDAENMSDTAVMSGDTAVIRTQDMESGEAEGDAAAETVEFEAPVEETADVTDEPQADAEPAPEAQPAPAEAAPGQPQMDPNVAAQQGYPPQPQMPYGMPQMPGYPPQMPGYPPQMPGYPYGMPQPGYPMPQPGYGMPQPGMPYGGYPQQPMGYPQAMPQQPMQQPVEEHAEEEEVDSDAIPEPEMKLPDPSETGLKEPVKKEGDDNAPKAAAPPNPAEEILKKYKTRR